ncbi:MAG: crotonase/enoyl-CoA hydratase family protein [Myxococcota bacterium]|nr:crotonase/enoyl-CoA hydratase family protein [Myxococcota bacterium]
MPESNERVQINVRGGVADVRLNRPEKMNALDDAMFQGIIDAGLQLKDDKTVRAVVLSGEGRAFCAGLDVSSFGAMAGNADRSAADSEDADRSPRGLFAKTGSPANRAQYSAWVWQDLPVPVIAAVHGVAYGGGFQIAMGADLRIVAPDARLSVMEVKWGLVPDMSATQTLKNLVRLDVAKELAFTGRIVSGNEAAELGLATQVSETPLEAAMEIAMEIASKSPDAVRASKRLFNETRELGVPEGFKLEEQLQAGLIGSANQVEAVKANLQKRDPKFNDPE